MADFIGDLARRTYCALHDVGATRTEIIEIAHLLIQYAGLLPPLNITDDRKTAVTE
jgi:hypothetical protein